MKRNHFSKSPKAKGAFHHHPGDKKKRRKSGGRGADVGEDAYVGQPGGHHHRQRSRSGGFQDFGNFLWTYDAATNHWVAREESEAPTPAVPAVSSSSPAGGHSRAAMRELNDFGREFPPAHKGKKGRGNGRSPHKGNRRSAAGEEQAEMADYAFIGFKNETSRGAKKATANADAQLPVLSYKSSSPMAISSSGASAGMMRFVKGETLNNSDKNKDVESESEEEAASKDRTPENSAGERNECRPVRWQSEPAIPKYMPIVSPSRVPVLASTPQQDQEKSFSGRGRGRGANLSQPARGRGRGRGALPSTSPCSPADFHWTYTETGVQQDDSMVVVSSTSEVIEATSDHTAVIKQEITVTSAGSDTSVQATTCATVSLQAAAEQPATDCAEADKPPVAANAKQAALPDKKVNRKQDRKNRKNEKKWKNKQAKNKQGGIEFLEGDDELFTTRDLVRMKIATGNTGVSNRTQSSEDDEENDQADEDYLFGRGGRRYRKGMPVKKSTPKKDKKQAKQRKNETSEEDEDSDSGMMIDDELLQDYLLNTDLADLNLDEQELEEHLLLHIVSQINDYHLDDTSEDDESSDDDSDQEEDDSEENIYDEYGDDEEEAEVKDAPRYHKLKTTPLGLRPWDDSEKTVLDSATEEQFEAVLTADFKLLRSQAGKPPSFKQRLQKQSRGQEDQSPYLQRAGKKWKAPERSGRGRQTKKKGKWYDHDEFNEETITDEEELPYIDRTPLKGQPRAPGGMITVHSINESIRSFIANGDKEWLELPPLNKKQRVMVHQLGELYNLKSKSYGSGRHRFPTLVKTIYTCYPPQHELLDFLNKAAKVKSTPVAKRRQPAENKKMRKLKDMYKREGGKDTVVTKRQMDGKVVGEGASPLGQETIGARLLLSMGWSGGGLVGTNGEGIAEPLTAIVKNNRKGLGF